ncbi:MAG: hypothetical protein K2O58_01680 [Bacteroidales bacterium]|nr:hypothetical protein [Bacteroidales bacterium]
MKRIIFVLVFIGFGISIAAQVKRPTLMVVPSDVWCNLNGYVTEYDNNGINQILPDYRRALQSDPVLVGAIARINMLMADRGFPLKNLESVLKSIERNQAESALISGKTTGAGISESPLDMLRRTARADIILSLTWSVNTVGPKKSITYTLQGLDAYTDLQVAGAQGTGTQSLSSDIPVLLEEAVSMYMEDFTVQLQNYFEDLENYGRLGSVDIRVFEGDIDLETEYGGDELAEIIDRWMEENTVGHMFNKTASTETMAVYEDVRMPLYRPNGMGMDAEYFVRDLRKFLAAAPYNIPSKIIPRGLGNAMLIIGEK